MTSSGNVSCFNTISKVTCPDHCGFQINAISVNNTAAFDATIYIMNDETPYELGKLVSGATTKWDLSKVDGLSNGALVNRHIPRSSLLEAK